MVDLNKPITTDAYDLVLQYVRENLAAVAQGLDPAVVTVTNPPTGALRWSSANGHWERFSGTAWGNAEPVAGYAINISGSAAKWGTGRTITLTGAVTGASAAWDGSTNLSIDVALATVPVAKGGTNITSYTIGDIIYASGVTILSKLAAVAVGNVLRSGGVGAAPAWGKVVLTSDVSGALPIANGGTGAIDAAAARANLGVDAAFPAGTRMSFNQNAAPPGWVKDTTAALNDSILRIVTGNVGIGGSTAFSTFNGQTATGAYTLTVNDMPAHAHGVNDPGHVHGLPGSMQSMGQVQAVTTFVNMPPYANSGAALTGISIQNAGGGGAHSHGLTTAIKYIDFIIATKA